VPLPVFESIIARRKATGDELFNYHDTVVGGKNSIPVELKIMSVLRTLSGGMIFSDAADATGRMSESTASEFFKEFNVKSTSIYARMGLPGAIGMRHSLALGMDAEEILKI
jgi:hypothetical protein